MNTYTKTKDGVEVQTSNPRVKHLLLQHGGQEQERLIHRRRTTRPVFNSDQQIISHLPTEPHQEVRFVLLVVENWDKIQEDLNNRGFYLEEVEDGQR